MCNFLFISLYKVSLNITFVMWAPCKKIVIIIIIIIVQEFSYTSLLRTIVRSFPNLICWRPFCHSVCVSSLARIRRKITVFFIRTNLARENENRQMKSCYL